MSDPIFVLLGGADPDYIELLVKAMKFLRRSVSKAVIGIITPPGIDDLKDSIENQLKLSDAKFDGSLIQYVQGREHFKDWNNLQYVLDIELFAKDFDPVIFVDTDIAILGDIRPFVEEFQKSGQNFAFLPDNVTNYPRFKENWEGHVFVPQTALMFFKSDQIPKLVNKWGENWKQWIEPAPFVNKKNPARFHKQTTLYTGQYALSQSLYQVVQDFTKEVKVIKRNELKVGRVNNTKYQQAKQKFLSAGSSFSNVGQIKITIGIESGEMNEKAGSPWVTVKVGDFEKHTQTITNTKSPEWNKELVFDDTVTFAEASRVIFTLLDHTGFLKNEVVGTGELSLVENQTHVQGKSTPYTVPVYSSGKETGKLKIHAEFYVEKLPPGGSPAPTPSPSARTTPTSTRTIPSPTATPSTPVPKKEAVADTSGVARNFFADPAEIPAWLTSKERIPQYAVDYAIPYYKETQQEKKGQVTDIKVNFFYNENEEGCLETTVVPAKGYVFKRTTWTNMWWKDINREIGMGKVRYKNTRKATDLAEARIEERRKDPAFAAVEKVVLGVATEYDYDFLKAYGINAKYRDPNVKKATCEGYAAAVVEAFAGKKGLVDHVETWSGGNHAWNVVVLTDGRKIYTDACWYAGNNIDDDGYVEHEPRRTAPDLTFDLDEFNDLGGGVDKATGKLVKAHFAFDDVKQG